MEKKGNSQNNGHLQKVEAAQAWMPVASQTHNLQNGFDSYSYVYIQEGASTNWYFGYGLGPGGANWSLNNISENLLNADYTNYYWRLRVTGNYNGVNIERVLVFDKQTVLDFGARHEGTTYGVGPVGPFDQGGDIKGLFLEKILKNQNPTVGITTPADNQTLAEGNTMLVSGEASDADSGNVLTVKYKINNGTARTIASGVSDGSSPLSFARTLTYSNKRIWDGSTDVAGVDLAEGVDHTLTVWAEDDQGGKSDEITRKFRVSHNKPPAITVDAFTPVQSGLIPPDLITISGTVSDPDGNTVTVTGKANNGAPQTLLSGVSGGNWSFSFPVSALQEGGNTITITATDQFGSSTVKTFNVNNAITKTPLDKGVARYKVTPPLGAAKEILAWMQREIGDLSVDGAASFVDAGQSEQYMTMAKSSVDLAHGIAEDEFVASVADPKADIVFKQTFTRANPEASESAVKLVGVIE